MSTLQGMTARFPADPAVSARRSPTGWPPTARTRLARRYFTQVLAKEFGSRQIPVNTMIPGATDLTARTLLGRLGTPADTAAIVAFLAGANAPLSTGQQLVVDGGAAI
jgi:3-oxoacyl-[acyl-carrier protein] reductase